MKKLLIISIAVLLAALILPILPLSGEGRVYTDTIRLHVLANSDSEEDQALKLRVRDAILDAVGNLVEDKKTREEAEKSIRDNIDILTVLAKDEIALAGYDYDVKITLDKEKYPEREYEGVRLPAGSYTSLRVLIGAAEGQNWWCVLFPPLCTSAAEPQEKLAEAGFTGEQIRVLCDDEHPKYVLRFRILEFFEAIFG
ncbi:MAG: stage II sporulation protein R [Clostridia bacterium]|nr:stage II sporulation protein R [Clostridia bacterium]